MKRRAVRRSKPKVKSAVPPAGWTAGEPRWFVMQIMPQLLETAKYNLKNQKFEYFFPTILKKGGITEPAFRGYGFVNFDPLVDNWASINGTKGVTGLLPAHSVFPTPLPVGLVEDLQAKDPINEADLLKAFEEYFPGITEVEVDGEHKLLGGRRGLVVNVRTRLLEVSFSGDGKGQAVWLDRDIVRKR